ncbi:PAAR domain-containing protein [Vibrio paucivorans]|uniref:PAAR domain-containing protein n=1 Tax=Vibrio paucivorans TaxID=2829489 RepID=A0A9X3CGX4_9VIBR|nr:PAAR domain-containing protein [Vibrio paucivorans]MCW8335633.1 PAAR domain-containing protein [Vibrio paucivorans]
MSNDAITVGCKTTTGGVVISGNSGVKVNNQPIALVGDIATCTCGSKSCKGKGPIVATSPRDIVVNGVSFAKAGDLVDTGCGNCYLVPSSNQVTLGASTASPVKMGSGVSIGNGVNINIGGGGVSIGSAMGNASAASTAVSSQAKTALSQKPPQIDPNSAYWPPYNPLAKDGEKTLNVEYVKPITSIAWMSPEEAHEFLQNLYEDMGYKETLSNMKDYGQGLGKGIYDAVETAKGLGGLGVQAYTKNINGQDWIIIKNYRKHLKTLERGHKWKANNPRIIQLGLGLNDLKGSIQFIRFNVGLEIAVSVGINAVDYALRDEATLAEFVGGSAGDIVKGILSIAAGSVITAAFAAPTATIVGTTLFFVGASFIFGQALNIVDEEIGFSEYLVDKAKDLYE